MINTIRTAGADLFKIQNKTYAKYSTERSEKIVLALDKSHIPFYARFNKTELSLTYDADYKVSVEEILSKIMSSDYDVIVAELKKIIRKDNYIALLPEIADVMNLSVSFLKSRPEEVQEILCKSYVNLWYCDTPTIKRELSEILRLDLPKDSLLEAQKEHSERQIHVKERDERERSF